MHNSGSKLTHLYIQLACAALYAKLGYAPLQSCHCWLLYWQAWRCRCCLAARKDDLIKYGRKLLKSEAGLWRDPEIIAEVLGLAEDTEHRGSILLDIEGKFTEQKVSCRRSCLKIAQQHAQQTLVDLFADCLAAFAHTDKCITHGVSAWGTCTGTFLGCARMSFLKASTNWYDMLHCIPSHSIALQGTNGHKHSELFYLVMFAMGM